MEEKESKLDVKEEAAADDLESVQTAVLDKENSEEQKKQIQRLETENRKMQNEFNVQRAKLKELFMQKESEYAKCQDDRQILQRELDELKSQFLVFDLKSQSESRLKETKAKEEISSLQQLVQDTIEETSIYKTDLERLKEDNSRLWLENRELRGELQQQQDNISSTPHMLSQVKKTLVRKLGGDSFGVLGGSTQQQTDSIDETARNKNTEKQQYAHEDAEVLRSIVEQLQEEMKVLKEKLRDADEKLQANNSADLITLDENKENRAKPSVAASTSCASCCQNEDKLKEVQANKIENTSKIEALQKIIAESQEDLQKEAALRKDLEDQWQEKREAHKMEVQLLRDTVKSNEQELLNLQQKFLEVKEDVLRNVERVATERESINKQLETLQADNDFLSGRYLATAEEIENQYINLPNTVEELQELILRQQSELIQARVGSEFEKQKCLSSLDEIQILRYQLDATNNVRRLYKIKIENDTKSLQDRIQNELLTQQSYETTKVALERKEIELNRQISELRGEIIELQESNEKVNKLNANYKTKVKNLQDDLHISEHVQKDFVKLSQTLQMELEKLRHADTEVRWQDEEDINNCPSCKTCFTVTVRKIHCRHCGHIYCDKCLTKTVESGPRKRTARVCDICHTLLTPNIAPYFSQDAVQSF